MSRRVRSHASTHVDRAGDPLDGLVNMFDLGIVLAVAFLLAALSALKLTGVLTGENYAVIGKSGSAQQTIVLKNGDHLQVTHLTGRQVVGRGAPVGTVYRLSDGRLVYVTAAPTTTTTPFHQPAHR
jgi:hypothetical protein